MHSVGCHYGSVVNDHKHSTGERSVMKIQRRSLEIETKTVPPQKRPSLIVKYDRDLHSKVGMMMDEERAAEFMNYLLTMLSIPICPCCHQGLLIWKSDFSFEDVGYEGDGIVTFYECDSCGAEIEVSKRDGTDSVV